MGWYAVPARPDRSNQNGAPSASNAAISRPANERESPSPNARPSLSWVVWMACPFCLFSLTRLFVIT